MICNYGCGNEGIFQFKCGKWCCSSNSSKCPSVRAKLKENHHDAKKTYKLLPEYKKDSMAWNRGKNITPNSDIFKEDSSYSNEFVKGRIIKGNLLEYKCFKCFIELWQGETIVLELDHINGKNNDHRFENLRFLCPNCHSQTDTFRGRNKNTGKKKVSDQELLTALRNHSNIRQALQSVGLAAKGGNYERAVKLCNKHCPVGEIGRHKGGPESPSPSDGNI